MLYSKYIEKDEHLASLNHKLFIYKSLRNRERQEKRERVRKIERMRERKIVGKGITEKKDQRQRKRETKIRNKETKNRKREKKRD